MDLLYSDEQVNITRYTPPLPHSRHGNPLFPAVSGIEEQAKNMFHVLISLEYGAPITLEGSRPVLQVSIAGA